MKNLTKKIFIFIATVIMLGVISVVASAETYGDLTYTVSNGEITITDCAMMATTVTIPSEIDGYLVTKIENSVFDGCFELQEINVDSKNVGYSSIDGVLFSKSLNRLIKYPPAKKDITYDIPEEVYGLAIGAFSKNTYLEEVIINSNITAIGASVFSNCVSLKTITIPEQIESINYTAFSGCVSVTKVTWLASAIKSLNGEEPGREPVFKYVGNSTDGFDAIFGNNITIIPAHIFASSNVKTVTIPDSVTEIGEGAFSDCHLIANITIPKKATQIGYATFNNCSSLESIIIPDSVTTIDSLAFQYCTSLSNVKIGESVETIDFYAFGYCEALNEIILPESLKSINVSAFRGCTSLKNIYIKNHSLLTKNSYAMFESYTTIHSHPGYSVEEFANKYGYDFREFHLPSDDWISSATCAEPGQRYHLCKYCDEKFDIEEIPALGHKEEVIPAKSATCTAKGATEGKKCSVCGEILVAQEEIPALGHKEEVISGKSATCTETGLTEGKKCSVCGEILVAQSEISALGHTEEVISGKSATCTETGLTEGKKCTVCSEILVAQEEIPALGHTEEVISGKSAICTETGLTEGKKCTVCSEILVAQEEIPALGHTEEVISGKSATCTETGLTEGKKCSVCGEILAEQEEIPATGHAYGEWTVVKNPTITEEGSEERTCASCGKAETRTIEKLNYLAGDINRDGKITAADARLALRIAAKLDNATEYQSIVADMNQDKKITAADARKILRISAKLE